MITESPMNSALHGPKTARRRIQKPTKPVNFYCDVPAAKSVCLVGDFNHWDAFANPMKRQSDGVWHAQLTLASGHHHYQFRVDGEARLDPKASGIARNGHNERVSLLAVG